MAFTIIVDGTNFISELERHGKDKDYILNKLSFPSLAGIIQTKLIENGLAGKPFQRTEFICSDKPLGSFKGTDKQEILNKLMQERGVRVEKIELSSKSRVEKAVDMTVFSRMLAVGGVPWNHVVLIAKDRDYVPAIRELMNKGIHVILIGFDDGGNYPIDLKNECYLFLDMNALLKEIESTSSS